MKTIIFFFLLTATYFAQSKACQFISQLDSVGTNYHECVQASEFAVLSITLGAAGDTVYVGIGTNLADSTTQQQEYSNIVVTDLTTGSEVTLITGNTTANRKYFIKWGYKQKCVRLTASSNANDTNYILEFY